jgi:hypothetical protein
VILLVAPRLIRVIFLVCVAQAVMPTVVPLLLFSGYLIPLEKIAKYYRFLYWMSPFAAAFKILQVGPSDSLFPPLRCSLATASVVAIATPPSFLTFLPDAPTSACTPCTCVCVCDPPHRRCCSVTWSSRTA